MEILIAGLGIAVLVLGIAWNTAPVARLRIRRSISRAGLILVIALMAIAYSKYGH